MKKKYSILSLSLFLWVLCSHSVSEVYTCTRRGWKTGHIFACSRGFVEDLGEDCLEHDKMTVLQERSIFLSSGDMNLNFWLSFSVAKWRLFAWHVLFIPLFLHMHYSFGFGYRFSLAIHLEQWLSFQTVTPSLQDGNYSDFYSFFFFHCCRECYVEGIKDNAHKTKEKRGKKTKGRLVSIVNISFRLCSRMATNKLISQDF